jgi:hypothetical protein
MGGRRGKRLDSFQRWTQTTRPNLLMAPFANFGRISPLLGKRVLQPAADAVKHSMSKFATPATQLNGLTANPGSGTRELFANACKKLNIWGAGATADSCGLHDLRSGFRLALQQHVGDGGLEARNAMQLLHTMFSFCEQMRGRWSKAVTTVWKRLH